MTIDKEITTEDRIEGLKRKIKTNKSIPKSLKEDFRTVILVLGHYFNTPDGREDAIEGLNAYDKIINDYTIKGRK